MGIYYNAILFKSEYIDYFGRAYCNLLEQAMVNFANPISNLTIILEDIKKKLLYDFNETKTDYPKDKTIKQLFEEQVSMTPDNVAIVCEDKQLTYKELNNKANILKEVILNKIKNNINPIGILMDNSIEMVISIFATIKCGVAYIPINHKNPINRIKHIISNSDMKLLLSKEAYIYDKIDGVEIIYVDRNIEKCDGNKGTLIDVYPNDLVYIIYTSGTTGIPKGVGIKNKSLINYVYSIKNMIDISDDDKSILTSKFNFDLGYTSIFPILLSGGELHLLKEEDYLNGEKIIKYIQNKKITYLKVTPTLLSCINGNDYSIFKECKQLRTIFIGGEKLKINLIKNISENCNWIRFINHYGPTEATIGCIAGDINVENVVNSNYSLIGKPLNNVKVYILDKYGDLVPVGCVGELCLSGECLSIGYINNKKLTEKKFIENPYESGTLLYKTGDLAKWNSDGNVEFLGRIDNQVKIHGFRIELEEIENCLLKLNGINEAVVVVNREDENKALCAYYTGEREYTTTELRTVLKENLPYYMIPSYFGKITKIPLTPNGKVDKKSILEMNIINNEFIEYECAKTEMEQVLIDIWQQVLGCNKIGINNDFFTLGGDSIKAIQVIFRLKDKGYYLDVKDIYSNSTIKDLAKCVKDNTFIINQNAVEGKVELTPIQIWFFEQNFKEKNHWNQSVMLFKKNGFEKELIEKAFNSIVSHHDALRMIYRDVNDNVEQINQSIDSKLYDLNIYYFRNKEDDEKITEKCNDIQSSISLSEGPLVKLGLFKTDKGDHLLIVIHHLVIDGVSWRILFEDLAKAYKMAENNEKIILQNKTTSFKEWAKRQKEYGNSYKVKAQLEYWNKIENMKVEKLSKDKELGESNERNLKNKVFKLTDEYTEKLLKYVNKAYNTDINDILLSALTKTICEWTGHENVLINLEGHGREDIIKDIDISRTIGWFTTHHPVVLNGNRDTSMLIKNIKDSLKLVLDKGIGYGIIKYSDDDSMKKCMKLKPDICFNYLGQFDEDIDDTIFSISQLNSGMSIGLNNQSIYLLNFSAMVLNKRLEFDIKYSDKDFNEETIKLILENYKNNLINIINHCVSKKRSEKTATDITKEHITLDELKPYLGQLENIKQIYPATPMQDGLIFYNLAQGDSEAYKQVVAFKLNGELDVKFLEESFNLLIDRHDILRTAFDYKNFNKNMQIVYNKRSISTNYQDISTIDSNKDKYIENKISEKIHFDLMKDELIRFNIIKTEKDVYNSATRF